MKRLSGNPGIVVAVSRRNLLALVAKLDGFPKGSECAIHGDGVLLSAEENDVHYGEREPGLMHPDTEEHIKDAA